MNTYNNGVKTKPKVIKLLHILSNNFIFKIINIDVNNINNFNNLLLITNNYTY